MPEAVATFTTNPALLSIRLINLTSSLSMSSISCEYPSRGIRRTLGLLSAKASVGVIKKHNKAEIHTAMLTTITIEIVILLILLPPFGIGIFRIVFYKN
jgi:hypothetical protein